MLAAAVGTTLYFTLPTDNNGICPEDSWPALVPDEDIVNDGTMVFLDDMGVYYVEPKSPSTKALLINYDSDGINSGRLRSICDQLSQDTGFHIAMPDYYRNETGINDHGGYTWNGCE